MKEAEPFETIEIEESEQSEDIQIASPAATMPRGNRGRKW